MKWTKSIKGCLKIPMSLIDYFGIEVIIGAGLCWTLGGGFFLVLLLICSPSY
ncbi:MAG: hypothetical protein HRU47_14380 [Verrucomicrobiales bacterium]|nr:hypothetical protein [Verrucomicrobiota bacterium]NRB45999.1 hypothetical protein [Verrucomicrobiales bacterium]